MTASLVPIAVSLICGVIIPAVVDLVTKWRAPDTLKAWLAAALAALAGALSTVTFTPEAGWGGYVTAVLLAFAATFAAHQAGVSKPVKRATARVGIGASGVHHVRGDDPAG